MSRLATRTIQSIRRPLLLGSLLTAGVFAQSVHADGTETLDAPDGLTVEDGSDLLLAGVGLKDGQPDDIELSVPAGVSVEQVIAYWGGRDTDPPHGETDTIFLNGIAVEGTRNGGPSDIPGPTVATSFRADVTHLGLVAPGGNTITVSGLDYTSENIGAGIAVIIDDGGSDSSTSIDIRDGCDWAFDGFFSPFDRTDTQTYTFDSHDEDRDATLGLFLGSISAERTSFIDVCIDGVTCATIPDAVGSNDGARWDTLEHDLTIPAGATSVSITVVPLDSGLGEFAGNPEASLVWFFSSFTLDTPEGQGAGDEACSAWFWLTHPHLWNGIGEDETSNIFYWHRFNETFGVSWWQSGLPSYKNLGHGIAYGSYFWYRRWLNRHAATALANADSGLNYAYSVDEVIAIYRDGVGADDGPISSWDALICFFYANWQFCPLQ